MCSLSGAKDVMPASVSFFRSAIFHLFCRRNASMFVLQFAQDLVKDIGKCFVRLYALAFLQQRLFLGIPFLASFGPNVIGMRFCY